MTPVYPQQSERILGLPTFAYKKRNVLLNDAERVNPFLLKSEIIHGLHEGGSKNIRSMRLFALCIQEDNYEMP